MNINKYLAFERHKIETKFDPEEVIKRIDNNIEPKQYFRSKSWSWINLGIESIKEFEGKAKDNRFRINRIINYRNSFQPIITGTISKDKNLTEINIEMQLNDFIMIFMSLWLLVFGLASLIFPYVAIVNYKTSMQHPAIFLLVLIPTGMFTIGYFMMIQPFRHECKIALNFIKEILEIPIEENVND